MDKKKVLITGGTGLIGSNLIQLLEKEGFETAVLSRSKQHNQKTFLWSIGEKSIDESAIEWADIIIHLAGANVGSKRWTAKRKKAILESRTQSTNLLKGAIEKSGKKDLLFISASAIGIYKANTGELLPENGTIGNDFLAEVTKAWEKSVEEITPLVSRTAIIRTGVVLSTKGGALEQMVNPVKYLIGAPLGSGKQMMSWIHIDDLCEIYLETIKNENFKGPINAVAPEAVSNKVMTKAIAEVLKKPLWLPNVPGFVLKIILGEMSDIVLASTHVVPKYLNDNGYQFKFTHIKPALRDLLLKE